MWYARQPLSTRIFIGRVCPDHSINEMAISTHEIPTSEREGFVVAGGHLRRVRNCHTNLAILIPQVHAQKTVGCGSGGMGCVSVDITHCAFFWSLNCRAVLGRASS